MVAEEDAGSNTSDDEAGMSSGDSGLLKDINENHKNDIKDSRFQENREKDINNEERQSSSSTTNHSGKYLNEGEKPYFNNKGGDHQSDLSALQKLYSLESMQRFAESSPVFPTREPYPGLPNYDKPLMIDVGPGRSFTGSTRMPTSMDTNRGESDKVKKKAVVREAVDPAKYVRIQDLEGIKFACSKCGNTYKWRKSLNKHWKEKHDGEIPTPHGQNLITLNIPQVKGKTTNINTALFSYAPLGAPPQRSAAGFSGTGMPTVAGKFKEKDPTYPSAEMLSKYEELSKQWMNFANAAAAVSSSNFRGSNDGRYSQKNVENHNNKRPSSPDGKTTQPPAKCGTPNAALPRSRSETPRSTPNSLDVSFATAAAAVAQNPFLMAAPPPAHSQGYRAVVDESDEAAPLDLSKGSKPSGSNSTKSGILDLTSGDVQKPKSDKVLDFSGRHSTTPPIKRETDAEYYKKASSAYRCIVCSHTFDAVADLNQHFAIFHIDVIYEKTFSCGTDSGRKDGTFCCIICGATYLYQIEILQHFEKNHPTLPNPYKKRANPGSFVNDYLSEPPRKRTKDNLHCLQCGFLARDTGELNRHHLVHSLNRPYACTRCGFSSKLQEELTKHMTKYHSTEDPHVASELQGKLTPGKNIFLLFLKKKIFHLSLKEICVCMN